MTLWHAIVLLGAIGIAALALSVLVAVRRSPPPKQEVRPLRLRQVQFPPYWNEAPSRSGKYPEWPAPKDDDESHGDC